MRLVSRMVLIAATLWAIRSLLFMAGDFWSLIGLTVALTWGLWETRVKEETI